VEYNYRWAGTRGHLYETWTPIWLAIANKESAPIWDTRREGLETTTNTAQRKQNASNYTDITELRAIAIQIVDRRYSTTVER